jgi:hypothetical protein
MDLVSDFRFMMLRAIIPKDDEMTGMGIDRPGLPLNYARHCSVAIDL